MRNPSLARGVIAGTLGGLAGDVAMQLFGAAIFASVGWSVGTSFHIIGDSAAAFFAWLGLSLAGGLPLGLAANLLIGMGLGAIWGVLAAGWKPLAPSSIRKGVILSTIYVEAMSVPLLALGGLSLGMTVTDTATWCGISAVMHVAYGVVLGLVMWLRWRGRAQVTRRDSPELLRTRRPL